MATRRTKKGKCLIVQKFGVNKNMFLKEVSFKAIFQYSTTVL